MNDELINDRYWWGATAPWRLSEMPITNTYDVADLGTGYVGLSATLLWFGLQNRFGASSKRFPEKQQESSGFLPIWSTEGGLGIRTPAAT